MDKGDTIKITAKFKAALKDLPDRFNLTDTEKNAVEFAVELYNRELAQLQTDADYKEV